MAVPANYATLLAEIDVVIESYGLSLQEVFGGRSTQPTLQELIDLRYELFEVDGGGSSITSSISSSAITTRGANTTAYAIDDVWGARFSLSLPTGLAADGTKSVILTKVNLTTSLTTLPTGFGSFRLFLFQNTTDSGNIADNAAFTQRTTAIDVDGYLLTQMQKSTNDLGGRSTTFDLNVPMIVNSGVTAFFGYLVTNAAIPTPLANADTVTIRVHFMVA